MNTIKRTIALFMVAVALGTTAASVRAVGRISTRPTGAVDTTSQEEIFKIQGSNIEFVILDKNENGYLIFSNNFFGTKAFSWDPDVASESQTAKYDVNDQYNIAHWLNNEFLESGNGGKKLPKEIKQHLVETNWTVEDAYNDAGDKEFEAKVVLMSQTEWSKYCHLFGSIEELGISRYWFLRSRTDNSVMMVTPDVNTGGGKQWNPYGVRPMFYVDDSFFSNVKLDIESMGDNVRARLIKDYSKSDLGKIYSSNEIEQLNKPFKPQAMTVRALGVLLEGATLEGKYEFYSPVGEKETNSVYRWLRASYSSGPYYPIYGANGTTYTLTEKDVGKYIRFEVTPMTDKALGHSVASTVKTLKIVKASKPVAENVKLHGKGYLGERLVVTYDLSDDDYEFEGETKVVFQRSTDGINYEDIQVTKHGAPSSNRGVELAENNISYAEYRGQDYVVTENDIGKFIRCMIIPGGTNWPYEGDPVYTESIKIFEMPQAEVSLSANNGILTATYTFDGKADATDKSKVYWEYSDTEDGTYKQIANNSNKTYSPDIEGYYRFAVEPENGLGNKGLKVISRAEFISAKEFNIADLLTGETISVIPSDVSNIYRFEIEADNVEQVEVTAAENFYLIKNIKGKKLICYVCGNDGVVGNTNSIIASINGNGQIVNVNNITTELGQIGFKK